jgi:DNA topoisomerase IA
MKATTVALTALSAEQHFTEPPPRFSEASLVKALEEYGIGRPSTYATIISTLQDREYVEMDSRRFIPTDIGKIVNRFLTQYFHRYVEYSFTAEMEDELDAVSRGEEDWKIPLRSSGNRSSSRSNTPTRTCRASRSRRRASSARTCNRQAHHRAHGALRSVRADRHQGR